MNEQSKCPKVVGSFIRQRRESLGLSQRALGLMFTPPVTTQFISNMERGVTPLPPTHIPILSQALKVQEKELLDLLEKEYTLKLNGRLGKLLPSANFSANPATPDIQAANPALLIAMQDYQFMREFYEAFSKADQTKKKAFMEACRGLLQVSESSGEDGSKADAKTAASDPAFPPRRG